ncbi:hypothetical protein HMPREF9220_0761 [Dialister micraerophilus UPII 345-E]|uniref:Uncharacterized protein n=1 Tax=Dialister micraerophilus UPII 345-E TaxID=910314 RepID=E4L7S6_9FIRM|nr:hypothetical protein HMPREF9220_0761 [Dialister micraerophilus UPII 345-E]
MDKLQESEINELFKSSYAPKIAGIIQPYDKKVKLFKIKQGRTDRKYNNGIISSIFKNFFIMKSCFWMNIFYL